MTSRCFSFHGGKRQSERSPRRSPPQKDPIPFYHYHDKGDQKHET